MTDNEDQQSDTEPRQHAESSVRSQPLAGTPEEREPERDATPDAPRSPGDGAQDELEAQAADDFYHDRPAATSARVFDAGANSSS